MPFTSSEAWFYFAITSAFLEAVAIVLAFHAVMRSRSPQAAVAWSIALVTIPWLSVPLYAFLGRRRFEGYYEAFGEVLNEVRSELSPLITDVRCNRSNLPESRSILQRELEGIVDWPFTATQSLRLLVNGREVFSEMLRSIASARTSIQLQSYILRDDDTGRQFAKALIERCQCGVNVSVLYDAVGSLSLSQRYVGELRAAGVSVAEFGARGRRASRFQINFRNHRKLLIVDGEIAFVGGLNIGDEYRGLDPDVGSWRDTCVAVSGPAVDGFQLSFLADWYWATNSRPSMAWNTPLRISSQASALPVPSGPADGRETYALVFASLCNAARHRLWIASPYYVPDSATLQAIILARLRGVDVRVLIPAKADHLVIGLAANAFVESSCEHDIAVYRYLGGFMHQKVILVDDDLSAIGSANLDPRSMRLNFESTLVTHDRDLAAEILRMLEVDFAASKRVSADDINAQPWYGRIASRTCALFSPML